MAILNIQPKSDDPQRLIQLNGVPQKFWLSAEEINAIVKALSAILGEETSLYKGEFDFLEDVEAAHPLPEPGSEAQIIVVGGDNLKASWDNTNKKWFLDGLYVVPGSNAAYLLKAVYDADGDGKIDLAKNIIDMIGAGPNKYYGTNATGDAGIFTLPTGGISTPTTYAINKINFFSAGYIGGLSYAPYMDFTFGDTNYKVRIDTATPLILTAADATYSRIDLIVGNSNGTITKITGVPAANPVEPAIDNDTQLKAAFILVEANATAPAGVSLVKIWDENVGTGGGEFAALIGQGAGWNLNDVSDPKKGTKAIKGTNLQGFDQIKFTPLAKIPAAEFTEVIFYVKNLNVPTKSNPFYLYISGATASGRGRGTATQIFPDIGKYGYDPNNITDWQFISVPLLITEIVDIDFLIWVNLASGFSCIIDGISYNDGTAPTGEEFASVGYVNSEVAQAKQEAIDAAKVYTDSVIAASGVWQNIYPTITQLLAGQANQTTSKPQFVLDASIDTTVNAANTWATYILKDNATKTGALTDYRKLSEQESLDVVASGVGADLTGELKFDSYPNTRNDGQLAVNKILSTDASGNLKMYSTAIAPAPFLNEVIPDSYLPSTTGMFKLKGSFFTENMTVTTTGGMVNYITFNNDNDVDVNITTGATEGSFQRYY